MLKKLSIYIYISVNNEIDSNKFMILCKESPLFAIKKRIETDLKP